MALGIFGKTRSSSQTQVIETHILDKYILFKIPAVQKGEKVDLRLQQSYEFENPDLAGYLGQLIEGRHAVSEGDKIILDWQEFDKIRNDPEHENSIVHLGLPAEGDITPDLESQGALSDPDFKVIISFRKNTQIISQPNRRGAVVAAAVGQDELLSSKCWKVADAVRDFDRKENKSEDSNFADFGFIRQLAVDAGAKLDDYIRKTVVITLDELSLSMRKAGDVVELIPGAEDIPEDKWLAAFDQSSSVQDRYDLPMPDGTLTRVALDPDVKVLLAEIKSFPGRRVAGNKAKEFIRNPYALLPENADNIILPETFEIARTDAGIFFINFHIEVSRDEKNRIEGVQITFSSDDPEAELPTPRDLLDRDELIKFGRKLAAATPKEKADGIDSSFGEGPSFLYEGIELEVTGEAPRYVDLINTLLHEEWVRGNYSLNLEEVLDLANYSERIAGIAVYKPIFAPYLKREGEENLEWLPGGEEFWISFQVPDSNGQPSGEYQTIKCTKEQIDELEKKVEEALVVGENHVNLSGFDTPIPLGEARNIIATFKPETPPKEPETDAPGPQITPPPEVRERQELLIKENIEDETYVEKRGDLLRFDPKTKPIFPTALRPEVTLKTHQKTGVAWLQNLLGIGHSEVRGCIFADDMGLGKTLQLLTFMMRYLEDNPDDPPCLVVVPVSLIQNWKNEIDSFFDLSDDNTVKVFYGDRIKKWVVDKKDIDPALREKGLNKHLKPGWRESARIIITSYDTLRIHDISFAKEKWGVMVCDEAQRIKAPNALVTRSAKKQNVLFRIACTGTPVENSLVDLWCLFDYIQPGLLPPLSEFTKKYRRPIEANSETDKIAVGKLRAIIDPQVLRRLKTDVADLPPKTQDQECLALKISEKQKQLYGQIIQEYNYSKGDSDSPSSFLLGTLHRLRMICADPSYNLISAPVNMPLKDYRKDSPKMDWLIKQLEQIQKTKEKVIIFTEFKDIQRTIQKYVGQYFGMSIAVINGETGVDSKTGSRQRILDAFQAKDGFNIIILSTTAIGFGVNIQKANHVIHYTRAWNPAKEDQATDRAYRIGQNKEVTVYCPTVISSDFSTFEVKLDQILASKRRLSGDMLNGSDNLSAADFADVETPTGEIIKPDRVTPDILKRMKGIPFEKLCALFWAKRGFYTKTTEKSGDHGVDLVVFGQDKKGHLVQSKSTQSGGAQGWEAIQNVYAGAALHYKTKYPDYSFELCAMANTTFNADAVEKAKVGNVNLIEYPVLEKFLLDNEITVLDLG